MYNAYDGGVSFGFHVTVTYFLSDENSYSHRDFVDSSLVSLACQGRRGLLQSMTIFRVKQYGIEKMLMLLYGVSARSMF